LAVAGQKEPGIAQLSDISAIADILSRTMIGPCLTKWPTYTWKVVFPTNTKPSGACRLVATQMHWDGTSISYFQRKKQIMQTFTKVGLDALLTLENCAVLLIDHQPSQLANVNSHEPIWRSAASSLQGPADHMAWYGRRTAA
jgi:hypothetical protein